MNNDDIGNYTADIQIIDNKTYENTYQIDVIVIDSEVEDEKEE